MRVGRVVLNEGTEPYNFFKVTVTLNIFFRQIVLKKSNGGH